ncbi:MAG TPA: TIGR02757 family protein [Thermoanaerobaculia bacterium]|nr:TIGR02757 family protein [Thermoanaerobaculia bacterium]
MLRQRLDALVATFDASTLDPDPLQLVLQYTDPRDQEVAGILAAAFAYGRADIVVANVGWLLERMRPAPYSYLQSFDERKARGEFAGFSHRFHKTRDVVALFGVLARVIAAHGTLGELFRRCDDPSEADIGPSLARFVEAIIGPAERGRRPAEGLRYLLSSPNDGSACKRMNLFLRWMVRRTPPDLGIWDFVDPARLVVPLDTHVHRIATFLGLNRRKSADWKTARAITDRLARFDRSDPVRYDFAICRLGILDRCSRKRRKSNCDICLLRDVCRFPIR